MEQGYYAAMLQLRGKRCVIAGGGKIAERKLRGLLEAGADRITVIAPAASDYINRLAEKGIIELICREYREEDARAATLIFAATNNKAANRFIADDGERFGALVQLTDDGRSGDFITPSVVRRGHLLLAVTASGESPALSAIIKRELEEQYAESYVDLTARLGQLRRLAYETLGGETGGKLEALLRLAAEDVNTAAKQERCDVNDLHTTGFNDLGEWLSSLLHRIDRRL